MSTKRKPVATKSMAAAIPGATPPESAGAHGVSQPNHLHDTSGPGEINPIRLYRSAPHERIALIKDGVPAKHIDVLAARMRISRETLIDTLRLSRATVNRKARNGEALSQDDSERVLGVEHLIGQVQTMIEQSGEPEGFDAAAWVARWLHMPLPALDKKTPASFMDTIEGQKMVSNLLAMTQTGAYA